MASIPQEYNEVETYFHGVMQHTFDTLEADGFMLWGRVGTETEYEEVRGQGFIYATSYEDRYNATPGAGAYSGLVLVLGWDGRTSMSPISKGGEILVPVEAYKVIGVWDPSSDEYREV